jgi:hypothetical protein
MLTLQELLHQLQCSRTSHPNLSQLWLHVLRQQNKRGLSMTNYMLQAQQALHLFKTHADLSVGQTALLLFMK